MPVSPEYRAFVEDQLGRIVRLSARRMFGGVGFYADDIFFGLLDDDALFFRVDDATRPRYESRGMEPFTPMGESTSSYYRVPEELLEDFDELRIWTLAAVDAAREAKAKKKPRKPRKRT